MNILLETLSSWLVRSGLDPQYGDLLARLAALVGLLLICALALRITRSVALRILGAVTARTGTKWDDELVRAGVFARLAYVVPVILFDRGAREIFDDNLEASQVVAMLVSVSLAVIAVAVVRSGRLRDGDVGAASLILAGLYFTCFDYWDSGQVESGWG